jgi:CheY-like chemotaxis protein
MALLPDSSKIHFIFQNLKPAGSGESCSDLWKEVVHIVPEMSLLIAVCITVYFYREPLRNLLNRLDGFEYGKLKLSFLSESFNGIIKVALAAKNRNWNVIVPEKDKERALKRALANRNLLADARILWVDDRPENDNNERRMFQQLGVYCDFAQTTESALEYLKEYEYHCVISDMEREGEPEAHRATAGIELIRLMRSRQNMLPVILYVGSYDSNRGTPPEALGITNRPDQLLHLLVDALERMKR